MKALSNPYVIGGLVALALVLGYFRFRTPLVVVVPPPVVKKTRPLIVGPEASMEVAQLGWIPAPARDPFRAAVRVAATISDHEADPVADALDLKAVWLQEGGGWAVINGKILGEGETILDFRVEKILTDGVLVQGPGGRRRVGFKPASPPSQLAAGAAKILGASPVKPTPGKPLTLQGVTKAVGKLLPKIPQKPVGPAASKKAAP